ncbi:MAG TPA: hypothetical protein ENK57_06310 [Polyangiaceae bacterium]|nr:hypothetical protein [Polyangiaceae bacterium]
MDVTGSAVSPGERVAVVRLGDEATMASLITALQPAATSLVRVKVAMDATSLLPLTVPQRLAPDAWPPGPTETAIVGHRKITRPQAAPRDRVADLRVEGAEVTIFVENGKPGGEIMSTSALRAHLQALDPPAIVFTLGASDDTPWPRLREVIAAAACFDRGPGEEPHEVLLPLSERAETD